MLIRWVRAVFFAFAVLVMSSSSFGQVFISVGFGPPPIPLYEQPLCPGDGYIWTPGYWAWSDDDQDYYWVPGTWVLAPEIGYLWTPPYWAWMDGRYAFYDGYWGPEVGFYGGIDYGFGYFGEGFEGGRWENGRFFYNRAVLRVDVNIVHNVYNTTVIDRGNGRRISYNGGPGGIDRHPTSREEAAAHQRRLPPAAAQVQHMQAARGRPDLRASANHGKPPVAATARPAAFTGREAVPAREAGGPYTRGNREASRPAGNRDTSRGESGGRSATAVHPNDLPPMERSATSAGTSKADRKYQQQQEKLFQKQQSERQKLQQQQEREHQKLAKQNVNEVRKQQTEQRHQQQTQQLQQRHVQQQQRMQQRAAPPVSHPEAHPQSKPR